MGDFPGVSYIDANGYGGGRPTTQVVVIHATDNTADALSEAQYCSRRTDDVSAHLFVDGSSAYQCVPLGNTAWCALYNGNRIGVHVELCGRSNAISDATMRRAAPLVKLICDRYGIPVRKVSASEVATGVKGICGHADITKAFPGDGGDHIDPGSGFAWSTFIGYVTGGDDMGQLSGPDPYEPTRRQESELRDSWAAVVMGTPVPGQGKSSMASRVERIEATVTALAARPAGSVALTAEDREAIVADLKTAIAAEVEALRAALIGAAQAEAAALAGPNA